MSDKNKRLYYGKVAVVGTTGTGKSYLTKTADKQTTGFINVENKPLSYKAEPFKYEGRPKSWESFMKCLKDYSENPEIERIIIDSQTEALDILNKQMAKNFTGYDVYKNYSKHVHEYLQLMKSIEKDMIITSHDDTVTLDGYKQKRMASHGKEFGDGKIERHFSVVLFTGTEIDRGKPRYFLKTFEVDTSTKTPEGLFNGELQIPNDAEFIFKALEEYYS